MSTYKKINILTLAKSSLRCGIARLKNVYFSSLVNKVAKTIMEERLYADSDLGGLNLTKTASLNVLVRNELEHFMQSWSKKGGPCISNCKTFGLTVTKRSPFNKKNSGQLAIGLAFIFMAPASLFFKRGLTTPSKTKTRFSFSHPRAFSFIKKPLGLNHLKNNDGQLAIGLAFIFMAFLALFSMVFQSSMLVREKIKLQQSVDYAALTGAQIQRAALDKIHALNEDILEKFYATQSALIPSSFIAFSGSNPVSTSAIVFSITNDPGANTGCGGAAQALDKFVRKKIVRAYETYRGQRVDQIMDIIENTNGLSHEHVVSQIIHTPNLPQRLRHQVIKAMGQDPNIDSLQASYQNGLIHDHLRVTSTGDMELPLFIPSSLNPANDMTAFTYPTYSSQAITAAYVQVCSFPFPSGIDVSPTKTIVGRHPASDKSWPSHFAVMAMYDPPSSTVEGKFNLKVKNPNAADEGNVSLAGGEDIDLMPRFDSQSPRRWPMLVASLAKPFGGKFPKAPLQALPHGNPGETFDGAKLIGFADYQRQLEGHTPIIPLLQEISDKYGITVEWDDIWH